MAHQVLKIIRYVEYSPVIRRVCNIFLVGEWTENDQGGGYESSIRFIRLGG